MYSDTYYLLICAKHTQDVRRFRMFKWDLVQDWLKIGLALNLLSHFPN